MSYDKTQLLQSAQVTLPSTWTVVKCILCTILVLALPTYILRHSIRSLRSREDVSAPRDATVSSEEAEDDIPARHDTGATSQNPIPAPKDVVDTSEKPADDTSPCQDVAGPSETCDAKPKPRNRKRNKKRKSKAHKKSPSESSAASKLAESDSEAGPAAVVESLEQTVEAKTQARPDERDSGVFFEPEASSETANSKSSAGLTDSDDVKTNTTSPAPGPSKTPANTPSKAVPVISIDDIQAVESSAQDDWQVVGSRKPPVPKKSPAREIYSADKHHSTKDCVADIVTRSTNLTSLGSAQRANDPHALDVKSNTEDRVPAASTTAWRPESPPKTARQGSPVTSGPCTLDANADSGTIIRQKILEFDTPRSVRLTGPWTLAAISFLGTYLPNIGSIVVCEDVANNLGFIELCCLPRNSTPIAFEHVRIATAGRDVQRVMEENLYLKNANKKRETGSREFFMALMCLALSNDAKCPAIASLVWALVKRSQISEEIISTWVNTIKAQAEMIAETGLTWDRVTQLELARNLSKCELTPMIKQGFTNSNKQITSVDHKASDLCHWEECFCCGRVLLRQTFVPRHAERACNSCIDFRALQVGYKDSNGEPDRLQHELHGEETPNKEVGRHYEDLSSDDDYYDD